VSRQGRSCHLAFPGGCERRPSVAGASILVAFDTARAV
jgi:hypothetical protein